MVVVPQLLLVELLLVARLLRRPRRKLRKRVRCLRRGDTTRLVLIQFAEKEESDEDMGFGLFD